MNPTKNPNLYQIAVFFRACEQLEASGNRGIYHPSWPNLDKSLRDGIVIYLTGSGWHVRKSPHWRGVFWQRFGIAHSLRLGFWEFDSRWKGSEFIEIAKGFPAWERDYLLNLEKD